MTDFLAHPAFHWIGVLLFLTVVALATMAVVGLTVLLLWSIRPRVHYRAPTTDMILSTYDRDFRDGEGRKRRTADDLTLTRILGFSWKTRWVFGLMLFRPADSDKTS